MTPTEFREPGTEPADDETRLIDRSRRGDSSAFAQLVGLHHGRVRAYIAGSTGRHDVVDDLAQEVFLAAFRSLDNYKPHAPLGVWLLGIARNKTLVYLRKEVRRLTRETRSLESVLAPFKLAILEADEAQLSRRDQELNALQRCIEGLPSPGAELIVDRYFKGRTIPEMARELRKREGAIRMTLLRIRQALRTCVEARMAQEGT